MSSVLSQQQTSTRTRKSEGQPKLFSDRCVVVRNLQVTFDEESVRSCFEVVGNVEKVFNIGQDPEGRPVFCVLFDSNSAAQRALLLDNTELMGHNIRILSGDSLTEAHLRQLQDWSQTAAGKLSAEKDSIAEKATDMKERSSKIASDASRVASEKLQDAKETAHQVTESIGEKAQTLTEMSQQKVEDIKESTHSLWNDWSERLRDVFHSLQDRAGLVKENITVTAGNMKESIVEGAGAVKGKISETLHVGGAAKPVSSSSAPVDEELSSTEINMVDTDDSITTDKASSSSEGLMAKVSHFASDTLHYVQDKASAATHLIAERASHVRESLENLSLQHNVNSEAEEKEFDDVMSKSSTITESPPMQRPLIGDEQATGKPEVVHNENTRTLTVGESQHRGDIKLPMQKEHLPPTDKVVQSIFETGNKTSSDPSLPRPAAAAPQHPKQH
eukprot:GILJ01011819.1.p1 GENE.GILJ01011819.1~~GILJ01011819.1.p1  ORF type:complete len:446 (-),score=86.91 GILJ01011819.1:201-1538(-)